MSLGYLSGCASTFSSQTTGSTSIQMDSTQKNYVLTEEEMKLDCRKLTGSTQVKILSLRGAELKDKPSSASQTMALLTGSIFGTNSKAQTGDEMKILHAYNNRLKEMGCKSFDLTKELANRPSGPLPEPTVEENTN